MNRADALKIALPNSPIHCSRDCWAAAVEQLIERDRRLPDRASHRVVQMQIDPDTNHQRVPRLAIGHQLGQDASKLAAFNPNIVGPLELHCDAALGKTLGQRNTARQALSPAAIAKRQQAESQR